MRRSHDDHKPTTRLHGTTRFLPLVATALLIAAATLGAVAPVSLSSTVETRVGAFEICYRVVVPPTATQPDERCFSYHRESAVMAPNGIDVAFYASACTMAGRAWRREIEALEPTLAQTLGVVCSPEGTTARGLAVVSLVAAFVGCLAMLDGLSLTNPNVRLCFKVALVCAMLAACCALTAYLSWTTVIRPNRHVVDQGASALMTLTSAGSCLGAAIMIYLSHRCTTCEPPANHGPRPTSIIA